ncbi:hypothetical protein J8J14_14920 [Roseomonas sp. SSH11]|uniref:Lipoprotein n=1 Tax=Pararoseomonas baculiformis TaxID=2820812 RepID=A0ABS4AGA5_9PROT|nr:hypothetical protein [Pararoseomonas baculiformis]MBP0446068.1 hypothetical protein [Pararoseomonas baculiformis]
MRPAMLLPLIAFAMAGCAQWEKPGATPQMRDATLARCEAAAFNMARPENITVMTDRGGWVPGSRECRGEGPNRRCRETQGYYRGPSYSTRDQNEPVREAFVEDCMRRDGWVLR